MQIVGNRCGLARHDGDHDLGSARESLEERHGLGGEVLVVLGRSSSPDTSMGSVSSRDTVDLGGTCLRTFCALPGCSNQGSICRDFPLTATGAESPRPEHVRDQRDEASVHHDSDGL